MLCALEVVPKVLEHVSPVKDNIIAIFTALKTGKLPCAPWPAIMRRSRNETTMVSIGGNQSRRSARRAQIAEPRGGHSWKVLELNFVRQGRD